jgi:hypothetical protein
MTAESIQNLPHLVIARSAATKQSILSFRGKMDCFASLAMTDVENGASNSEQHL